MDDVMARSHPLYDALPTIYEHHDQLWAGTPAHWLDALYSDFDYRSDDVWLSSYPRSGTAWSYEILYAVLYDGDIEALQQAQASGRIQRFGSFEVNSAGHARPDATRLSSPSGATRRFFGQVSVVSSDQVDRRALLVSEHAGEPIYQSS
jgi:hypothetical protein